MSLTEYRRKRHFGKTREPEPGKPLPKGRRAIFVVQLHHASRRHYDFRLQVGDALKSWAVPKGPSFDPQVKRLAVEVEDHPVDYANFEGMIPAGEYGGGHVALFDRGVWSTQGDAEAQLAKGHLRFELFGERLHGGWHLVRSGRNRSARQPEWLLFKEDDEFAGDVEADQLLDGVAAPPADDSPRRTAKSVVAPKKTAAAPAATSRRATPSAVSTRRTRRIDWSAKAAALPGARKAVLKPGAFDIQLARISERPPEGAQWLHELKWDGYRLLAVVIDGVVSLWSRNALEWTAKAPETVAAIERLGLRSAAFDGELIAGAGGQKDFGLLQATLSGERQAALSYVIFDVLHLDGYAIDRVPLQDRKALLAELLKQPIPHLAYSSHIVGDGAAALDLALGRSFEGILSKRADRGYQPGRNDDWRKIKSVDSDEFAVVGYTAPRGSRSGFGSLLLARPDPEHGWSYAGRVGSGFSDELLDQVMARIGTPSATAGRSQATVHVSVDDPELRRARWFPPCFVVEVFSRGRGNQGLLRQPSLKAVRLDKEIADLMNPDRAAPSPRAKSSRTRVAARAPKAAAGKRAAKAAVTEPVRISSPERVVYPDRGTRKQQVADYYRSVMDHLLPEVIGRPLSIVRCPDGVGGACFYQKHLTAGLQRVGTVKLKEESGNEANYLVVEDAEGLMELVQFNGLEFHPWGAKASRPGRADRIVFDLDPGPDVPWAEVKRTARKVRELLEQIQLVSFLRTSGGKGLHVVVPLNPGCDWALVKRFAHGFADALAHTEPQRYVATATKALRKGRIFIDYLRNGRGATSVASYSLRARPGAPVAMPLAWTELARLKGASDFDIDSVPRKLKRRTSDPWEGIDTVRQDLSRWKEG